MVEVVAVGSLTAHTHSSCTDRWWGCLINTGFDGGSQRRRRTGVWWGGGAKAMVDCKQQSWSCYNMTTALEGIQGLDSAHNSLLMTHPFACRAADYLNTIVPVK